MNNYIEDMKRRAKSLARSGDVTHAQALEQIANSQGFSHWGALIKQHDQQNDAPLVMSSVRVIDGDSLAQIIQKMIDRLHAGVEQVAIDGTCVIDMRSADFHANETSVDTANLPIASLVTELSKDLHKVQQFIEVEPRDIGLISQARDGKVGTTLQIKFSGGLM